MNEILLDAAIADLYARIEVQGAVLKAVVMAHPFPLQIDQDLKEAFPKLLGDLKDAATPSASDFAEAEAREWRATLHARLNALSRPKGR